MFANLLLMLELSENIILRKFEKPERLAAEHVLRQFNDMAPS